MTKRDKGIVRAILTADNHLSAYSPKLSPKKLADRRKRLGMAFKQSVDIAIDRQVHLFIQAGDLFDNIDPRNLERDFVAEQLMRLQSAGIQTFAVSGNHDTPRQKTEQGGFAPQHIYGRLKGMHYFDSSDVLEPTQIDTAGLRLALAGLSYHPGIAPGTDPLDHVEIVDSAHILESADLGIVVLHAAIEGHAFPSKMETFVRRSSLSKLHGFRVVLAGHVHAYDRFSVGDKAIVVCGATECMEFGQREDKIGCVYLELTADGLHHAEHIPIKPQPRQVLTIRTTELWPSQMGEEGTNLETSPPLEREVANSSVMERIFEKLESVCTKETMVRLTLEGPITRDLYHQLDLRSIWLYGQQRAFSFEIDESRLSLEYDLSGERIERGERVAPRDVLESIIQEWMEQTETANDRDLLTKTRQQLIERYDELTGRGAHQ